MGAFLDKPKTDKHTEQGAGNGLRYGLSSMQGWRVEMEDAHCAVVGLPHGLSDWSFFAVFDGHAGPRVSVHCAENLLDSICLPINFIENADNSDADKGPDAEELLKKVKSNIRDGFLQLDEKMRKLPEVMSGEDHSGSTAVCVLISPGHIFFANCGDSRTVLSRSGRAIFSTQDHKPMNPTEKERIMKAGGSVMIQRVNGSLAVSRALGDYEYKQVEGMGPCQQLVSPEPEVTIYPRDDDDEFLVLACDGIWDVMGNDDLCDFVRHSLTIHNDLDVICSHIIDTCLYKGSKDNMSVVLVTFKGAPSVSAEAQQKDKELNAYLETKVQEIVEKNTELTIPGVFQALLYENIENLPPGGGLDAKRKIIEETYDRVTPIQNENSNSEI